jgi:hypothetical protein
MILCCQESKTAEADICSHTSRDVMEHSVSIYGMLASRLVHVDKLWRLAFFWRVGMDAKSSPICSKSMVIKFVQRTTAGLVVSLVYVCGMSLCWNCSSFCVRRQVL